MTKFPGHSMGTVPGRSPEAAPLAYSTFLFPQPSFWIGVARLLDFGQGLVRYNYASTAEEADFNALLSDWKAVGDDVRWAIKTYEAEGRQAGR